MFRWSTNVATASSSASVGVADGAGMAVEDFRSHATLGNRLATRAAPRRRIAAHAAAFRKPVLLLQGDSHSLLVDTPAGMPANVTRVVVQGSTSVPHEWLRLRIDPTAKRVFTCENVVFRSGATTACPGVLAP